MPPPDSPNPSPTQEVETWNAAEIYRGGKDVPDGPFVTYEDHQRLLQAEVEKREEAEKAGKEVLRVAFRLALQLLRDKGTEQGGAVSQFCGTEHHVLCPGCTCACHGDDQGGDAVADARRDSRVRVPGRHVARPGLEEESGPETSQGPYACPDCGCRFATLGAPCYHPDHVTFYATTVLPKEAVEEGDGVAIEGDPGLEELLGWVREQRDKEADLQAEATGPMEDLRGGAVSAFEQVEHRIREQNSKRGSGEWAVRDWAARFNQFLLARNLLTLEISDALAAFTQHTGMEDCER